MTPALLGDALKEWAVVCRALGEGRQVVIFRKGGIVERSDGFALEAVRFFLLPTLEHQNAGDVVDLLAGAPGGPPAGPFPVDLLAEAAEVHRVPSLEAGLGLLPLTVHTPVFLEKRWNYRPDRPLFAVLLKVFRRDVPWIVPSDLRYAGCVSWATLSDPLSTAGFSPVLSEEAFSEKRFKFLSLLPQTIS